MIDIVIFKSQCHAFTCRFHVEVQGWILHLSKDDDLVN